MVEDIFSEIDGDIRAEQNAGRNRKLALYGAVLLVVTGLVLGGWQFLLYRQHQRAETVAVPYFAAEQLADSDAVASVGADAPLTPDQIKAQAAFSNLAAHAPEGFATLSRLRYAALAWRGGDHAAALGAWDRIAQDDAADPDLRGLGTLLWVQHQSDGGDPAVLKSRLRDLLRPGNPWRALALETDALIDLRTGHTAEAKQTLQTLSQDPTASESEHARAAGLLDTIDPKNDSKTGG